MVGPTWYLIRADSATVARVWSRNTMTEITETAAISAASGASSPSVPRRARMMPATARAPTSSGASATSPCGARVTENIATTVATA